jgi:zinc/manganese transport system ATP-binding protein
MSDASVTFSGLTLGYNSHPAVHHLTGVLNCGSLTAVVGPNGSGKSTLMKGIVGILRPMSGTVQVSSDQSIAYLPQQSEVDRTFPARVIDLVALGLWPSLGLLGRIAGSHKLKIKDALDAVGLAGFENRPIDTLSGGQLQRALFARVILQDADLILLDEPFNAIDTKTVTDLIALVQRWHTEERTVLVVAHDISLVREHFPQTLLLARQQISWGVTADTLTTENLARARRFTEAWNENADWCDEPGDMGNNNHVGHNHAPHNHATHEHTCNDPSHHHHQKGGA